MKHDGSQNFAERTPKQERALEEGEVLSVPEPGVISLPRLV
jgi:hypothetical protein